MKKIRILFLTLAASFSMSAAAQTTTYDYSGSIETYVVPAGVSIISIQAYGAQGGNDNGGLGAGIFGRFSVTPGTTLNIVVGQQGIVNNCGGADASGGGGGGSFIWDPTDAALPLIAAGAGGGGNENWGGAVCTEGLDGQAGEDGTSGAEGLATGGTGGNGGAGDAPSGTGSGGGGWLSAGQNSTWGDGCTGGETVPSFTGGSGAASFGPGGEGGFGGGGGSVCGCGGGSGYSGGAGGNGSSCRAGGGGSYNQGTHQENSSGVRTGNGQVIITVVCGPETMSLTATTTDEIYGTDGEIDITVTGGTPTYSYDWDTDGTGDFDDTEDITGLTAGSYIVSIKDDNECLFSDTIMVNSQVGIEEINGTSFSVYPNPTVNKITVVAIGGFNYSVYTINGKLLKNGSGITTKTISLADFPKGIYVLEITNNNITETIRVIKE